MELALYCASRALESFGIWASEWKHFEFLKKLPKRIDVVLFSLSTAVIMHCYNNERDVFKSKYLNVLDWVFGLPPGSSDQVDQIQQFHETEGQLDESSLSSQSGLVDNLE